MITEAENKIDYIEIPARDVAASKKFFADLFGWEFTDYGPDYTSFSDGRMFGGFSKADTVASEAGGSVLIVFYRHDLEAACDGRGRRQDRVRYFCVSRRPPFSLQRSQRQRIRTVVGRRIARTVKLSTLHDVNRSEARPRDWKMNFRSNVNAR